MDDFLSDSIIRKRILKIDAIRKWEREKQEKKVLSDIRFKSRRVDL